MSDLTDGEVDTDAGIPVEVNGTSTEATLIYALNDKAKPAVYLGKSTAEKPTQVKVKVKYSDLVGTPFFEKNNENINAYIGNIGYLPQFYNIQNYTQYSEQLNFKDDSYYFEVELNDEIESVSGNTRQGFFILERETALPPSLYDLA